MNIANILTLFRLLLVPAVAAAIYSNRMILAAILFSSACLTDMLDGYLARRLNLVTNLGKLLDPLADKLMTLAVLVSLGFRGMIDFWIIWIFLFKEIIMIFVAGVLYKKKIVISSIWYGKLATVIIWTLILTVIFLGETLPFAIKLLAEGIAASATLFALFMYGAYVFKTLFPKIKPYAKGAPDEFLNGERK